MPSSISCGAGLGGHSLFRFASSRVSRTAAAVLPACAGLLGEVTHGLPRSRSSSNGVHRSAAGAVVMHHPIQSAPDAQGKSTQQMPTIGST